MRAPARTFEDLLVLRSVATTQSSSGLAESASVYAWVYHLSRTFPRSEIYDVSETSRLLEEVSKLLEAYSQSILNSDS